MTSTPPPPIPVKMIPDDFVFEKTLGVGAFSKVSVAMYTPDGKRYAVKMIPKRLILGAPTEEERKRLMNLARREMNLLIMCNHPGIIRFYASMQTNDDLMYVTEMCEGGELLDMIKRRGTIPLHAACHMIAELLSAVDYLHSAPKRAVPLIAGAPLQPARILHRDIKPENVMLTESKHVKLIDFGTAVLCETNEAAPSADIAGNTGRAATFCGTTQYMSPELLGDSYTCVASDYWAVGCILFHMLAGRRPYEAPTQYLLIKSILDDAVQYPADMDAQAKDLISKLLVKNPTQRLGSDELGGFATVKKHPFFQGQNWDTLWTTDVSPLWQRDMQWVKDSDVTRCRKCGKDFNLIRRKHHCRNCGHIFCDACSSRLAHIPESSYQDRQRVCDPCYDRILRVA